MAPLAFAALASSAHASPPPHRSEHAIPSSNGRASIAFDVASSRINLFLEHPYATPSAGTSSRNFAYDSYPGVRVGGSATWLPSVAPTSLGYDNGTGIVHVTRVYSGVTIDEYHFTPMGLAETASVMLVKVTRTSAGSAAVDAFGLFNFHLGSGSPAPGTDGENSAYNASRDAFYEWGPSGVAFGYGSLGTSTHHATAPASPSVEAPYQAVQNAHDLADNAGTGGAQNDATVGFQTSLGTLAQGQSAWAGWFTVLAHDALAQDAVDRVRTWVAGRAPAELLAAEESAWTAWITAPPAGTSPSEAALARQAQAVLRMAQVQESGKPAGQILASVAPGKWNIAWVRDMAYATVALARTGHLAEAKAALAFQMGAAAGGYTQYVGVPYQISVVRYRGDGTEESDSNADGPNVEFDGFGLFLWALDEYVKASNDTASLATWWPVVKSKVADVLVHLQEAGGLIAPDSSIWEVHWNGKQRHFAYTTITAANGLCSAARLATKSGATADATTYLTAGQKARDALLANLRSPNGTLVQSTEALADGHGFLDAAAVEAMGFGLVYPDRRTAHATMGSIKTGLTPPSGRGFMRNDLGAWYDSQEWIFVDLRSNRPFAAAGDSATANATLAWNVDQATENFGELSELHDRVTADYAGESPMVGFGAGAYLLALGERGVDVSPTCQTFADEPLDPIDGGTPGGDDGGVGPGGDDAGPGGGSDGGGVGASPSDTGSSCACGFFGLGAGMGERALGLFVLPILVAARRRKKGASCT